MKNIIFLTYLNLWSMDNNKGAPSFYKTIDAYLNSGWNVTLIHPNYKNGVTPKIDTLNDVSFNPIFYPLIKLKKIGFFGRILHSMQGNYVLFKLGREVLKKYNYKACIYAYEVHGVKAGKRLAEDFKLPLITRFQGTVLDPIKDTWINRLRKYPHFNALSTNANITIMTDDGTKGDKVLKRLGNNSKSVKFWRNGVDIITENYVNNVEIEKLRIQMGITQNDKVLMTISRLASWKKVNRAIEALSIVVKEYPHIKLVIVGDGDEKQNLIKLTNNLNLNSNVIFAGSVPQTEIRKYLELADIFMSLYDLSNVGNPLLEAMSCGKPIITLDVGDTSSLISNEVNGILLKLENLDRLPDYILRMINDKSFADNLGKNAKQFAKNNFWSWEERLKAELDIVNQLYENWEFGIHR